PTAAAALPLARPNGVIESIDQVFELRAREQDQLFTDHLSTVLDKEHVLVFKLGREPPSPCELVFLRLTALEIDINVSLNGGLAGNLRLRGLIRVRLDACTQRLPTLRELENLLSLFGELDLASERVEDVDVAKLVDANHNDSELVSL